MKKINFGNIIRIIFLVIMAALTLFPVIYTVLGSFKSTAEILLRGINIFPKEFNLENYKEAWVIADFKTYTINSIYYSATVVAATIFTSCMGGYVFAKGDFIGKKIVFAIFSSTMFIALGSASLYPTLKIARLLHLNNSIWGVVVIRAFGLNIANVYLVKSFVKTLPQGILEAGKIDGCGFFGNFIRIVLPLLKPMIATLAILSFQGAWNDYLLPMVFTISNKKQAPLAVGLANLKSSSQAATNWGIIFAGACFCIIPILIVYCIFNRYFVEGITAGSVKE